MGFTHEELLRFRDGTVDDVLGSELRLLVVGVNPGLWTAAVNAPFAYPGNRFYPGLAAAGIISHPFVAKGGLLPQDRDELIRRGVGITNLVNRATARADELSAAELQEGAKRLAARMPQLAPKAIMVAGIVAYRTAFQQRSALLGKQPDPLGGVPVWVVPNPSGLNAHATVQSLGRDFRVPAEAAGIELLN